MAPSFAGAGAGPDADVASRGGRPVRHDTGLYKKLNIVERLINILKVW